MFFDDHPEFLETSTTASFQRRLNLRHLAIIEEHREILRGARVLDIASHDGRWSFAALEAGAVHVTGVEGRPELVANARRTFEAKGVDDSRYTFVTGDVHDVLTAGIGEMDVVLCLGFLYHTMRYPELLSGIRATGARHVIVDSRVTREATGPFVRVQANPTSIPSMAVADRCSYGDTTLAGLPTAEAIESMLLIYGYQVASRPDWERILARDPRVKGMKRYSSRERVTMLAADVG
jgi:hypothetical protein